jgi:SPP1 gp7 family putative phage head morphogenesis protein
MRFVLDQLELGETPLIADEANDVILTRETSPEIAKLIQDIGDWQLSSLGGIAASFNMIDSRTVEYLNEYAGVHIRSINDTTRRQIITELAEGISKGEGSRQLARRVRSVFDEASVTRSVAIARTETTAASNFAREAAFHQAGPGVVTGKQWLATRDRRTRDRHRRLNRQIVGLNRDFEIDGMRAKYPGGFASAAMNVNCRCTILPVVPSVDRQDADEPDGSLEQFDKLRDDWEERLQRAFRRGFRKQEAAVMRVFRRLDDR